MKKRPLTTIILHIFLLIGILTISNPSQGAKNIIHQPLILCQQKTYVLELNHALKTKNQAEIKNLYESKKCLTFPPRQGLQYTVTDMPDNNGVVTLDIFFRKKQDRAYTYESWLKNSSILDSQQ